VSPWTIRWICAVVGVTPSEQRLSEERVDEGALSGVELPTTTSRKSSSSWRIDEASAD
jgi:hypothetical protein